MALENLANKKNKDNTDNNNTDDGMKKTLINSTIIIDQTERFSIKSNGRNEYIMILYDFNNNAV